MLRFYQISYQVVADDEWHALQTALYGTYGGIVTHFGYNDYCIPLTLLYKVLAGTLGLSELIMRIPMLACGIATLVICPLLARDWIGRRASILFGWLLAIAPMPIYFSRYARPYSITLLLAFVAIVAFFRWWHGGGRGWLATYVGCAIIAPYVQLVVAPFVLAPMAWAGVDLCLARRPDHRATALLRLLTVAVVVGLGLSLLLAFPLWSDWRSISDKLTGRPVTSITIVSTIGLFTGTTRGWLLVICGAAVLGGIASLWRTQRRALAYVLFASAVQVTCSIVSRPAHIEVPIVFARYNLSLLPFWLLFVASGVIDLDRHVRRFSMARVAGAAGAVVCGLLLYFGPLREIYYRPNNWTNHALFQYAWYYEFLRPPNIPAFYQELARRPRESVNIVEAPWYYEWHRNSYPYYQRVHGQRMFVGMVDDVRPAPRAGEIPLTWRRLDFDNFVHVADAAGLLRRSITFVVFHRDFGREVPELHFEPIDVTRWIQHYRRAYGGPVYEDRDLVVFDVTRRTPEWP